MMTRCMVFTLHSCLKSTHSSPVSNQITHHDLGHISSLLAVSLPKGKKMILLSWKVGMESACVCPTFLSLDDAPCAPFVTWLPWAAKDYLVCLWNYEIVKQLHTASFSSDVSKPSSSAHQISCSFPTKRDTSRSVAHMWTCNWCALDD